MIIYKATNKINGKIYIGQTRKTLKQRIKSHLWDADNKSGFHFHNAIRKYGIDNFTWETIFKCSSIEELEEKEKYFILKFDSYKSGYNMTTGGEGCDERICKETTKEKLRNVIITDERKKKISEAIKLHWVKRKEDGKDIPWNKGLKTKLSNDGSFKKGQVPWNKGIYKEGSERLRRIQNKIKKENAKTEKSTTT